MNVKELEKKRLELNKQIAEIQAQQKVNKAEAVRLKKEILEKTGLKQLDNIDEYMSNLELEVNVKSSKLMEALSKLEALLVEVFSDETKEFDIEEELNEV